MRNPVAVIVTLVVRLTVPLFAQQGTDASTRADTSGVPARYHVTLLQFAPPKLGVTATLPVHGSSLTMETTRPGDIPQVLKEGWPALIRNLQISDESGRPIEVEGVSSAGWGLKRAHNGWLTLKYEVDYSIAAALGWPAPRESAFEDSTLIVLVGRSLFITTPEVRSSTIAFSLPPPWRAITPWDTLENSPNTFTLVAAKDLVENLVVLSPDNPNLVSAGGFRVYFTATGHWRQAGPEIRKVLQGVIPYYVTLMDFEGHGCYSVILLPIREDGGEAFRNSFALTANEQPSGSNRPSWGHKIAHEIFHYWNGLRLHGSDYASSQWFQEGFTDYAADIAMIGSGLIGPNDFRQQLARHIRNYQRLTSPLDAPGDRKGPPLYSGGALVAFCWDVQIRHATGGKHTIGDFLRLLWRRTHAGQREYGWNDIHAALDGTANLDWSAFFRDYISGKDRLPLTEVFSQAGLRITQSADGPLVEDDPAASADSRSLWQALIEGR